MVDRLQAFLYVLMRDELSTGHVFRIVEEVHNITDDHVDYSNAHLAEMARGYADKIRKQQ